MGAPDGGCARLPSAKLPGAPIPAPRWGAHRAARRQPGWFQRGPGAAQRRRSARQGETTMSSPRSSAVATLAQLAGSGDPAALETLACMVRARLVAHARRALSRYRGAGLDVEDVAQEVVADVQAFLAGAGGAPGWGRFQESRAGGALDGWLFG